MPDSILAAGAAMTEKVEIPRIVFTSRMSPTFISLQNSSHAYAMGQKYAEKHRVAVLGHVAINCEDIY